MESIELLECMISTEISKVKHQIKIAHINGRKIKKKALYNKLAGLRTSLNLLYEVQEMEE